jgi:hypothetical protein
VDPNNKEESKIMIRQMLTKFWSGNLKKKKGDKLRTENLEILILNLNFDVKL